MLDNLTIAEMDVLRRQGAQRAAPLLPFSADGYRMHYYGIFNHSLPPFAWDWIQEFFEARENGYHRFLCKAHRGATKSTIWTIGFASYVIAKFPEQGILITQKNDSAAGKTSTAIADIIENNAGWRAMYPNIVPDKTKKWAFEGYEIVDTSVSYEEWRQKVADARPKDNSFNAYGWANGSIVGMHPYYLFIDDICDEENTRSKREMNAVLKTLKSNILQTLNRPPEWDNATSFKEPYCITSYTPWYEDDPYSYLEGTGLYYQMETPLISPAEDGQKGAFEWRNKWWTCAWDVKDPKKLVDDKLSEYGEYDFARMQLLDLTTASGINLKREWLHEYPAEKIGDWPVYIGVDYASTSDKLKLNERDYFSLSVGKAVPGGGVVLLDGYRAHVTPTEAENVIEAYYRQYNPVQIGFDKTGKGEEAFYRILSKIPVMIPCPPKGMGKISKGERFEGQGGLGPAFQFSQAWVSDIDTPFIKSFRDEWSAWPNGKNDDTLDSTYWMLFVARAFLNVPAPTDNLTLAVKRKKAGFAQIASILEGRR